MGGHSEFFKNISIRGRYGYAAICLEKALMHHGQITPPLQFVLDLVWEFTSTTKLDDWLEKVMPLSKLRTTEDYEFDFGPGRPGLDEIRRTLQSLPEFLTEILDNTLFLGIAEIYSGIISYSPRTHKHLMEVIRLMEENNIGLPPFSGFDKFPFAEDHGWGAEHDRTFFYNLI